MSVVEPVGGPGWAAPGGAVWGGMSGEAEEIGAALASVSLGRWRGGTARQGRARLEDLCSQAAVARDLLEVAEDAMRAQGTALGDLVRAAAGVR